jgi:hypothetical protein
MRISVTELDAYRRYRDNEDVELESLLAQLRRQEPPTRAMLAGKALHGILETIGAGELAVAERDGFKFHFKVDCEIAIPPVREIKGEMQFVVGNEPITLVGVVDALGGTAVDDHKLTARFDAERYADSYQWRCYLVMFGAERFNYNVFVGDEDADGFTIYDFHRLTLYTYPEIREDVLREVGEFVAFASQYLPERLEALAA